MGILSIDFTIIKLYPILASSLAFAMRVLDPADTPLVHLWTPTLIHYTKYKADALYADIKSMAEIILVANKAEVTEDTSTKRKLIAVAKKYAHKKFYKISLIPQIRSKGVENMAAGGDF